MYFKIWLIKVKIQPTARISIRKTDLVAEKYITTSIYLHTQIVPGNSLSFLYYHIPGRVSLQWLFLIGRIVIIGSANCISHK